MCGSPQTAGHRAMKGSWGSRTGKEGTEVFLYHNFCNSASRRGWLQDAVQPPNVMRLSSQWRMAARRAAV